MSVSPSGQAIDAALGDRAGIRRYAHVEIPMDEALARCSIDVSGRPYCRFSSDLPLVTIGGYEAELTEEFFRAVATNAKLTLHLSNPYGANAHHMIEGALQGVREGVFRHAVSIDPEETGVPDQGHADHLIGLQGRNFRAWGACLDSYR